MAFDKTLVQDILKHSDIVNVISNYINVTKKGRNFVALCPFHDDKHPSLQINRDKQIFKCFVCGEGGDAISFVHKYEKIQFMDAARKVADLVGYSDERLSSYSSVQTANPELKPYYECMKDTLDFYRFALTTEQGEVALEYLTKRQIDEKTRDKFQIGYSLPDGRGIVQFLQNKGHSRSIIEHLGIITMSADPIDRLAGRLIFPIFDRYGRVVAFSGRKIDDTEGPKYINSPESKIFIKSNVLYNFHQARDTARHLQYLYVLEGFMDVIALSRAGIEAAVAIMGTAFTKNHVAMLRMPNVELRICLDGDDPGQAAMLKMIPLLDASRLTYRFVANAGDTRDPDDIITQEGSEALKRYLDQLVNRLDFALDYYGRFQNLKTTEQRMNLIKKMLPLLAATKSELELEDYLNKLSKATSLRSDSIARALADYKKRGLTYDPEKFYQTFRPEQRHLRKFQHAERQLLYMMLNDVRAIDFYKTRIEYFYDDMYRQIANFIIERSSEEELPSLPSLIADINQLDSEKKTQLTNEITALALEKDYPKCDEALLNEIDQVISSERRRFYLRQQLKQAIEGKDDLEKARIVTQYNKLLKQEIDKEKKAKEPKHAKDEEKPD